jgi:hypothetical protein
MVVLTTFLKGYAASAYGAYADDNRQAGVQATIGAVNRARLALGLQNYNRKTAP